MSSIQSESSPPETTGLIQQNKLTWNLKIIRSRKETVVLYAADQLFKGPMQIGMVRRDRTTLTPGGSLRGKGDLDRWTILSECPVVFDPG